MYIAWWNIVILAVVIVYLLAKVDDLSRRTKRLRGIIAKLEGEEDRHIEMPQFEMTGDADGRG